ncbi:MAG: coproporphyrinogen-III oxidase family protein [bacterium]
MTADSVRRVPGAPIDSEAGNSFVSNYPPYSCWTADRIDAALGAFAEPADAATPLGLYVHVPFCRKRCRFCYFKVSTDQNAAVVERYVEALVNEAALVAAQPFARGRPLEYVYFGGGTPSYLSTQQLARLVEGLRTALPWSGAKEISFECEPGTLTERKVHAIRELGVTRLCLGVESFDDHILEVNGRAHLSKQAFAAFGWARAAGLPQINVDLIAGMLDETEREWNANIDHTLELAPDSVTIYPMEVPLNTILYRDLNGSEPLGARMPDWDTKRRWQKHAFARLEAAGYTLTSAYTAVKDPRVTRFVYRDALWHGADMIGLGVASFGHVDHAHYQNVKDLEAYVATVESGRLPLARALAISHEESLVREMILQMKLGRLDAGYFRRKFDVDILTRFAEPFAAFRDERFLTIDGDTITLERDALLQVDAMLRAFYLPEHRTARYT